MIYPSIDQYLESIADEENFEKLRGLRPVSGLNGRPYHDSGNFSVVFKMSGGGKTYALKCFTRELAGRGESYKKISSALSRIGSPYFVETEYIEDELFVGIGDGKSFPVLKMEWVEGETLEKHLRRVGSDSAVLSRLADGFAELSCWLLSQPIAHGDIKPDNILVRKDGSLVLVDYDGMYVPTMLGEKSREGGTRPYVHPGRKSLPFDTHIDDYPLVLISLLLRLSAVTGESYDDLLREAGKGSLLDHFADARCLRDARITSLLTAYHIVQPHGVIESSVANMLISAGMCVERYKALLPGSAPQSAQKRKLAASNMHNGHVYVDMGLSVKWATCNVGADSPGDYGNYYAWGETETKQSYDEDNCATWDKAIGDIGGTNRDVAHAEWGGSWRMPTEAEFEELLDEDNCSWEWTTLDGHNGYKVRSKKTGNSIFLPAAGWRLGTSLYDAGGYGN